MEHLKLYESFAGNRMKFVQEVYQEIFNIFQDDKKIKELHDKKSIPIYIKDLDITIYFGWFKYGEYDSNAVAFFCGGNIENDEESVNINNKLKKVDAKSPDIYININPKNYIWNFVPAVSPLVISLILKLVFPGIPKEISILLVGSGLLSYILGVIVPEFKGKKNHFSMLIENIYLKFYKLFKKTFQKMLVKRKESIIHELVHLYDYTKGVSDFNTSFVSEDNPSEYYNEGTERNAYFVTDFIEFTTKHKAQDFEDLDSFALAYMKYLSNNTQLSNLSDLNLNLIFDFVEEYYEEAKSGKPINKEYDVFSQKQK